MFVCFNQNENLGALVIFFFGHVFLFFLWVGRKQAGVEFPKPKFALLYPKTAGTERNLGQKLFRLIPNSDFLEGRLTLETAPGRILLRELPPLPNPVGLWQPVDPLTKDGLITTLL